MNPPANSVANELEKQLHYPLGDALPEPGSTLVDGRSSSHRLHQRRPLVSLRDDPTFTTLDAARGTFITTVTTAGDTVVTDPQQVDLVVGTIGVTMQRLDAIPLDLRPARAAERGRVLPRAEDVEEGERIWSEIKSQLTPDDERATEAAAAAFAGVIALGACAPALAQPAFFVLFEVPPPADFLLLQEWLAKKYGRKSYATTGV